MMIIGGLKNRKIVALMQDRSENALVSPLADLIIDIVNEKPPGYTPIKKTMTAISEILDIVRINSIKFKDLEINRNQ